MQLRKNRETARENWVITTADNPENVLSAMLANVSESVPFIQEENSKITFMSMDMLDEEGIGEIITLQERGVFNSTPVILLTDAADYESVMASRDLGLNDYLVKPAMSERLIRKIVEVLTSPAKTKPIKTKAIANKK